MNLSHLLTVVEWVGTFAFAVSGAATAIERNLDLFGVLFMAMITAAGGGCMRDVLLGRMPPLMFTNPSTAFFAVAVATVIFIIAYRNHSMFLKKGTRLSRAVDIADALGLGMFAVVGTGIAMDNGFSANAFLCISMGALTGCGGGALRDVLSHEIPFVFTKHIYAIAAIAGSIVYYYFVVMHLSDEMTATLVSCTVTVTIRVLAIYRLWNLPKVGDHSEK